MNVRRAVWTLGLLAVLVVTSRPLEAQPSALPEAAPAPIEVQERGPIHEAYAQPIEPQPGPTPLVPKQPPPPVPELPPEQRPAGENVEWLPGYWSWDAERNEFLWVSGVYRNAPQGRRFVPGYWTQAEGGWQWVPGFWAPAQQQDLPYVPEPPPPSLERGPSLPPPDDAGLYVPGNWMYRDGRYAWSPGYWSPGAAGQVWVAPRYQWTPRGCVFVSGYWDYPLAGRGLLFAPVAFRQPLWTQPGWAYRPSAIVSVGAPLLGSLFTRPHSGHYYYGNYHGRAGYQPWYAGAGRFDPLYGYYRQHNRGNPNWTTNLRQAYRAAPVAAVRPTLVAPLSQARNVRLVRAAPQTVAAQRVHVERTRAAAVARRQYESRAVAARPAVVRHAPTAPVTVHRSAVVNRHTAAPTQHRVAPRPAPTRNITHAAPQVVHRAQPAVVHRAAPRSAPTTHVTHAAPRVVHRAPAVVHRAAPVHHAPAGRSGHRR